MSYICKEYIMRPRMRKMFSSWGLACESPLVRSAPTVPYWTRTRQHQSKPPMGILLFEQNVFKMYHFYVWATIRLAWALCKSYCGLIRAMKLYCCWILWLIFLWLKVGRFDVVIQSFVCCDNKYTWRYEGFMCFNTLNIKLMPGMLNKILQLREAVKNFQRGGWGGGGC